MVRPEDRHEEAARVHAGLNACVCVCVLDSVLYCTVLSYSGTAPSRLELERGQSTVQYCTVPRFRDNVEEEADAGEVHAQVAVPEALLHVLWQRVHLLESIQSIRNGCFALSTVQYRSYRLTATEARRIMYNTKNLCVH